MHAQDVEVWRYERWRRDAGVQTWRYEGERWKRAAGVQTWRYEGMSAGGGLQACRRGGMEARSAGGALPA